MVLMVQTMDAVSLAFLLGRTQTQVGQNRPNGAKTKSCPQSSKSEYWKNG